MKKFLSILMSLIMCFSLVACGSKEKYEMTGIYSGQQWYFDLPDSIHGYIEFNDADWNEGTIYISFEGDNKEIYFKNKQVIQESNVWDGKLVGGNTEFIVVVGVSNDGTLVTTLRNRDNASTMTFSFK